MSVQKLIDATFFNKDGQLCKVKDIIEEHDYWQTKDGVNILSHAAVKKLARIAGISKNYDVIESERVEPSYKNELEHIVRIKIKCLAHDGSEGGCFHDVENHMIATGEANRTNTSWRGRDRLRMMAEKRGYDIAVLEHVGLHTMAYSEEESEAFSRDADTTKNIYDTDIEAVAPDINMINTCRTVEDLEATAATLKEKRKKGAYTTSQLEFLYGIYGRKLAELQHAL